MDELAAYERRLRRAGLPLLIEDYSAWEDVFTRAVPLLSLVVTGPGGVPGTGVTAVLLNVTVTEPSAGGWLTVFPSGTTRPLASTINFAPGQTIANAVVAKVGAGGQIDIYNFVGNTHVIVDVQGWFG